MPAMIETSLHNKIMWNVQWINPFVVSLSLSLSAVSAVPLCARIKHRKAITRFCFTIVIVQSIVAIPRRATEHRRSWSPFQIQNISKLASYTPSSKVHRPRNVGKSFYFICFLYIVNNMDIAVVACLPLCSSLAEVFRCAQVNSSHCHCIICMYVDKRHLYGWFFVTHCFCYFSLLSLWTLQFMGHHNFYTTQEQLGEGGGGWRKTLHYFLNYKTWDSNTNKNGSTTFKDWTTPDCWNTPSTSNLEEEEETVDAPGNDGNASMPEQVLRPNPWRKIIIIISLIILDANWV